MAQFKATESFLGFMYSSGSLQATEMYTNTTGSNVYDNTYANTTASYKAGSFIGQFSKIGKKKFNINGYFAWILGGGTQKYHIDQIHSSFDNPQEEFMVFGTLKTGAQFTYVPPKKDFFVGLRYFNWWNISDGLRTMYANGRAMKPNDNGDDGGAVGLFGSFKRFGVDFSYAPSKLSFIRKRNILNFGQIELSYSLPIEEKKQSFTSLIFGARYEFNSFKDIKTSGYLTNSVTANGDASLISIFIGIGATNF